ncbi:MAG: cytochrome c [Terracidiphilus sp.]
MLKRLSVMALAAGFVLAAAYASPNKGNQVIPVDRTNPTDGKLMYQSYCAPCHGVDGRGNGPAAIAMKTQPVDLTQLARMNHGNYPESHIASVLQFGTALPSHGSAAMPIWGHLFDRIDPTQSQDTALRVGNLTRYLETMQVK